MVQHEAVVIRLGEGGSLSADVARLFGGCGDCSSQNNLNIGQMGSHPTRQSEARRGRFQCNFGCPPTRATRAPPPACGTAK